MITTIFHELNHFKFKYDRKLGIINKDIVRSIKEELLRKSDQNSSDFSSYYKCNYIVFSEEKLSEINAINNLITLLEISQIKLSEQDLQQ